MISNPDLVAVLDLGTNTFNLLIRDLRLNKTIFNTKIAVKLGHGGLAQNRIMPDAFERGLQAVIAHVETAKQMGAFRFLAFATSAIRSTTNGSELSAAIQQATGISIHVIDGMQEAQLIFKGVCGAIPAHLRQDALIMDIGGGSTEFVLIANGQPIWSESYPLGASRILEILQPADPMTTADHNRLMEHLNTLTEDLQQQLDLFEPSTLIGSSGSFDTMYDLIACQHGAAMLGDAPMCTFDPEALQALCQQLLKTPLSDRLLMPGMLAMRADMMPISAAILLWLFDKRPFEKTLLSTWSLKEGVFETLKQQPDLWHVSS
jgi:exopolyphosphatase/guanosine-5'-triphosphate,3'-diphosphate pyrophosphatase